jgi:hypothetical protein
VEGTEDCGGATREELEGVAAAGLFIGVEARASEWRRSSSASVSAAGHAAGILGWRGQGQEGRWRSWPFHRAAAVAALPGSGAVPRVGEKGALPPSWATAWALATWAVGEGGRVSWGQDALAGRGAASLGLARERAKHGGGRALVAWAKGRKEKKKKG